MDTVQDFEDLLALFERHEVRYLIVGGLAFIYHAKPRYTKDIDLWVDPEPENVARANRALAEYGSPFLLEAGRRDEVVQLGVAPNRIDLLQEPNGLEFAVAWSRRVEGRYGHARANWIDLDSLIEIKSHIDHPRHREDVRVLRMVRERRGAKPGENQE